MMQSLANLSTAASRSRSSLLTSARRSLATSSGKAPVRVAVTGASGQIGYSLLFRIASGEMLGKDQPVILQLLELPGAMQALQGVAMEIDDCAFPLVHGIRCGDDPKAMFEGADYALLVGARPRGPGMERADLLKANAEIFKVQGEALNATANRDTLRALVVGNPANTNAMIASRFAPNIDPMRIHAMTKLDHNRALAQIVQKCGGNVADVKQFTIWGNHSPTMYPDVSHATLNGKPIGEMVSAEWLENEFTPVVQQRGAAIIKARGLSSAASAANAAIDHMREWTLGTNGEWTSFAVCSTGNEYGVKDGIWYSFPTVVDAQGNFSIVKTTVDAHSQKKLDITEAELVAEQEAALA